MDKKKRLTELQLKIINVMWERGEATVADILECLEYEKDLARTTIATIVGRLEQQKIISHRKRESAHIYYPLVSRKEMQRSVVSDVVDTLFKGARSELVSHLLNESEHNSEEIQEVIKLIKDFEGEKEDEC